MLKASSELISRKSFLVKIWFLGQSLGLKGNSIRSEVLRSTLELGLGFFSVLGSFQSIHSAITSLMNSKTYRWACFKVQFFSNHNNLGSKPTLLSFDEYATFCRWLKFKATRTYFESMPWFPSSGEFTAGMIGFKLGSTWYKINIPSPERHSRLTPLENHRVNSLS